MKTDDERTRDAVEAYKAGDGSQHRVARMHGISQAHLSRMLRREKLAHAARDYLDGKCTQAAAANKYGLAPSSFSDHLRRIGAIGYGRDNAKRASLINLQAAIKVGQATVQANIRREAFLTREERPEPSLARVKWLERPDP